LWEKVARTQSAPDEGLPNVSAVPLGIGNFTVSLRGALATKQSSFAVVAQKLDCFAEPVIGRRFAPTRWLAMTLIDRSAQGKIYSPQPALRFLSS
jgi:hypothetical protein